MLVTTDLHLTDRSQDEYRWRIFDEIRGADEVLILGDLTDAKDGHSARLVNRIIDALVSLECPVHLLQGNHDYVDDERAFFGWLSHQRVGDMIQWYDKPTMTAISGWDVLMLPHSRQPVKDWGKIRVQADLICCHQTFNGANAGEYGLSAEVGARHFQENHGYEGVVLSGDVHVPQRIGQVMYVGCPYHVSFADRFDPRVIDIAAAQEDRAVVWEDLYSAPVNNIRRHTVDIQDPDELEDAGFLPGDQVKIRVQLPRSDFGSWSSVKRQVEEVCVEQKVELFSLELRELETRKRTRRRQPDRQDTSATDAELVERFCAERGVAKSILKTGVRALEKS